MTRYLILATAFLAVSGTAQEPKPPVAPPAKADPGEPVKVAPKSILGTVYRWYEFLAQKPPAQKKAPNTITLRLNLKAVKIAELAKQLKVKLTTIPEGTGDASLTLQIPIEKSDDVAAYKANGHIDFRDLRYGAIGIPQLSSDINLENGLLRLDNATMKLFDGVAKATLRYPVAGNEPGSLDGSFTNLPLARFGEWGGEPKPGEEKKAFPVGGVADGTIKATFPAPDAKGGKTKIDLAVTKGDVTFSGLKADKLTASAEQANGVWNYRVDADALGGKVDISGQYPPGAPTPPGEAPKANPTEDDKLEQAAGAPLADVRIRDVSLPRLLRQFVPDLPASARGLRGRVNLSFVLRQDADGFYLGSGLVRLDGLRVPRERMDPRGDGPAALDEGKHPPDRPAHSERGRRVARHRVALPRHDGRAARRVRVHGLRHPAGQVLGPVHGAGGEDPRGDRRHAAGADRRRRSPGGRHPGGDARQDPGRGRLGPASAGAPGLRLAERAGRVRGQRPERATGRRPRPGQGRDPRLDAGRPAPRNRPQV